MITSTYSVKLSHGSYDGQSSVQPTVDYDSDAGYIEGFTLLVEDGTDWICTDATVGAAVWAQNTKYDEQIATRIVQLTEMLFDYLNNPFYGTRPEDQVWLNDIIFSGDTLTSDGDFLLGDGSLRYFAGDNIRLVGSIRNDGFYDIVSADSDMLVVDRDFPLAITDSHSIYLSLVAWPDGLQAIAARMVAYDVYTRGEGSDVASEAIGTYSYSKDVLDMNGIAYPTSVVAGIMVYKVPKFV